MQHEIIYEQDRMRFDKSPLKFQKSKTFQVFQNDVIVMLLFNEQAGMTWTYECRKVFCAVALMS